LVKYEIQSGALPEGISLNPTTGCIIGTPRVSGAYFLIIRKKEETTISDSGLNLLTDISPDKLFIPEQELPNATEGMLYQYLLNIIGGTKPYKCILLSGSLPDGINIHPSGIIYGITQETGIFEFQIRVIDSKYKYWDFTTSLAVQNDIRLRITTSSLSSGITNTWLIRTLQFLGGVPPVVWSIDSGNLPAGLTLTEDGTIIGIPTIGTQTNFTVRATDSVTDTITKALSILIRFRIFFEPTNMILDDIILINPTIQTYAILGTTHIITLSSYIENTTISTFGILRSDDMILDDIVLTNPTIQTYIILTTGNIITPTIEIGDTILTTSGTLRPENIIIDSIIFTNISILTYAPLVTNDIITNSPEIEVPNLGTLSVIIQSTDMILELYDPIWSIWLYIVNNSMILDIPMIQSPELTILPPEMYYMDGSVYLDGTVYLIDPEFIE